MIVLFYKGFTKMSLVMRRFFKRSTNKDSEGSFERMFRYTHIYCNSADGVSFADVLVVYGTMQLLGIVEKNDCTPNFDP